MLNILFLLFLLVVFSDRSGKRKRRTRFFFPWGMMSLFDIGPHIFGRDSGFGPFMSGSSPFHSPFGGFGGGFGSSFGSGFGGGFGGLGGFGGGHSRGGGAGRHF